MKMNDKKFPRTFLYNEAFPKGKIFDDEAEYMAALDQGWAESPQDIGKDPEELKKKREAQAVPMRKVDMINKKLRAKELELSTVKVNYKNVVEENEKLRLEIAEVSNELEQSQQTNIKLAEENESLKSVAEDVEKLNAEIADVKKELEAANAEVEKLKKKK
jgi:chromosome segregation ATPase